MNLLIGTRVPAVNSTNRLLVYFQDVYDSIPESLYEGSRANGTEKNVIGKAKLGSPVAATSKELNNGIPTRSLPTTLEADDTTAAWAVPSSKLPYSGIAAVFLAGTDAFQLRSYVQKSDNTIQEYMWNGNGWEEGTNLGTASPVLVSEPPPSAILTTMAQASGTPPPYATLNTETLTNKRNTQDLVPNGRPQTRPKSLRPAQRLVPKPQRNL
ncbi:aldo-keto reductase yakc [NADP(+)] [Aspergillus lentulus]|uniref:fucose-specific lectin FleA n=1 Tax=Aspergillus lentulus TaxID=293939 RepID=UPI00139448C7|nr:aldo-keto reductase yakc [NADP(+)] [Aspergillus lentulus]GFF31031.1 aldo-keto reductase yakc [NADP(+)] [Aspergillus lentulus]GFF85762.1 aldo-keto reductase yakc [NADP(+)] [Aspergillus lentulus]